MNCSRRAPTIGKLESKEIIKQQDAGPSIPEAEAGGSLSWRPVRTAQRNPVSKNQKRGGGGTGGEEERRREEQRPRQKRRKQAKQLQAYITLAQDQVGFPGCM